MCIKSSGSEGVAEGRGSNMSVKIPCVWLASLALNGLAAHQFAILVLVIYDSPYFNNSTI